MSDIFGLIERNTYQSNLNERIETFIKKPKIKNIKKKNSKITLAANETDFEDFLDGIVVLIDGNIFNKKETLSEDYKSNQDLNLIKYLYTQYGFEKMLNRINGECCIALYDDNLKKLFISRDRVGIKPLYFFFENGNFSFSSKPINLAFLQNCEINKFYASRYLSLHYRYIDNNPEESPFKGINQLIAGKYLCFHKNKLEFIRYWSIEDKRNYKSNEAELADKFKYLFFDSIKERLKVSTNPTFTLSGGLDSSSVLKSAEKVSGNLYESFSATYKDKTFDETKDIETITNNRKKSWNKVNIDIPNVIDLVKKMIKAQNEPIPTATWLSHFLICERVSQSGFNELYGGLGGDELHAGEYEYFAFFFADLKYKKKYKKLDNEILQWIKYHNHPIWKKDKKLANFNIESFTNEKNIGECLPDIFRMKKYINVLDRSFFNLDEFSPIMENKFSSFLKNRTYQDLTRETTPCCLRSENRHSSYFGLKNFLPFLDYRIVEFMFRVPEEIKIKDGVLKNLLRKSMKNILPNETRLRIKKTGWNAPAHIWFSRKNEDFCDLIHSQKFKERGIYDIKKIYDLFEEHNNIVDNNLNIENHMMFFWQLLNLELWFEYLHEIKNEKICCN